MLSIITAIYNQHDMNRLYYETLKKYTFHPFELIIIDNGSTDGSCEYFAALPEVTLIKNDGNYSYPYCQNLGIKHAKYDLLVFMNNDIVVSKHWDKRAMEVMLKHRLEVATCVATDRIETDETTYRSRKRWKRIRIPLITLFGARHWNLRLMCWLMYGNWERYTELRYTEFGDRIALGISGSNVLISRSALDKIGWWDERIQAADFDVFMRTRKRHLEVGDIQPAQLLLGVYLHHYCRLTMKAKYPPFKDGNNLMTIQAKWGTDEAERLTQGSGLFL